MTEQLGRRCALVILAALTLATGVGLLAWGPVVLDASAHVYAGERRWLGLPNAINVLCNLPLLLAGLWGWHATRTSPWPPSVRLPWQGYFISVAGGALVAAVYHAAPGDAGYVVADAAVSFETSKSAIAKAIKPLPRADGVSFASVEKEVHAAIRERGGAWKRSVTKYEAHKPAEEAGD